MAESETADPVWRTVEKIGGVVVGLGVVIVGLSQHNQVGWLIVGLALVVVGSLIVICGLIGVSIDLRRRETLPPSPISGFQMGTPSFILGPPPGSPAPLRVHFQTTNEPTREMTTPAPIAALRFTMPREQVVRAKDLPKAVTGRGFPRRKIITVINFGTEGGFTYACHQPDIELEAEVLP